MAHERGGGAAFSRRLRYPPMPPPAALTLAELDVRVLTSFVKLIKLLRNLMKLLPNRIMV